VQVILESDLILSLCISSMQGAFATAFLFLLSEQLSKAVLGIR
jgi:hypothetical protein